MSDPKVKICGVGRPIEAVWSEEAGADYVGVVLAGGFDRTVSIERAGDIRAALASAGLVTVRVDDDLETVVEDAERLSAAGVQLHGNEAPDFARELNAAGPWFVWKAIRVRTRDDLLRDLDAYRDVVDGLVLDGWHPERVGGTGRTFDWDLVAEIRASIPPGRTLIAAGGFRPDNVGEAIAALRPDVVDVSSGVESEPGVKDRDAVRAFVRAARAARLSGTETHG